MRVDFAVLRQILRNLRGSYTKEGRRDWFNRPRYALNDKTPANALLAGNTADVIRISEWLVGPGGAT